MIFKICRFCGKQFIPRSNRQLYCDREHRRICPSCGSVYIEKYPENLSKPPRKCCSYCGIQPKTLSLPQFETIDQVGRSILIQSNVSRGRYENLRISQHLFSRDLNPVHVFPSDNLDKLVKWCEITKKLDSAELTVYKLNLDYAREFLEENDIVPFYKHTSSALGLVNESKIYQIMTFSKPRYNKIYDYEIIRCCTRNGFQVKGGVDKLSSAASMYLGIFNCITYQDLSKQFNYHYYEQIGMNLHHINRPRIRCGKIFDCGTAVLDFR